MSTIQLGTLPHQVTRLGNNAYRLVKDEVERVLIANSDLFAWSPANMPGIDPDFMCHKLTLLPQTRPIA